MPPCKEKQLLKKRAAPYWRLKQLLKLLDWL